MSLAEEHARINGIAPERCRWEDADVFSALRALRNDGAQFDVIVLDPNLPDCWAADSYRRLTEQAQEIPFLILTGVQDLGFLAQASPLPFAVLAKGKADASAIRRLLISAALRKRALTFEREP